MQRFVTVILHESFIRNLLLSTHLTPDGKPSTMLLTCRCCGLHHNRKMYSVAFYALCYIMYTWRWGSRAKEASCKTRKMYAAINISAGYEFWVKIKNDESPKNMSEFSINPNPIRTSFPFMYSIYENKSTYRQQHALRRDAMSLCRHRCTTTRSLVTRRNPIPFMFLWRKIFRVLQYFPQP